MKTVKLKDKTIKYKDDQATKDKVFDTLIKWYFEHDLFSGECICQSDRGYIESPQITSDLADNIIKFKVKYNDE